MITLALSKGRILDETLPPEVTLFDLASGTPLLWEEQRDRLIGTVKARVPR
jgi:hypothetical protein